jgi:hypothetical protein
LTAHRNLHRTPDSPTDALGAFNGDGPLGDWSHHAEVIGLLKSTHALGLRARANRQRKHRHTSGIGFEDSRNEIGDAWSRTSVTDANFSRHPGICHCHECPGRLMANQDRLDRPGIIELIIEVFGVSGQAE